MNDADRRAFFESVRPLIAWLARRLSPRGIEPDDVMQAASLIVWRDAHLYDPDRGLPSAWVRTIVIRSAAAMARKRVGQMPVDAEGAALEVIDPKAADPSEGVVTHDTAARVRLAVGALPDRERRLVGMRFGPNGFTLAEAGNALGISGTRAGQVERRALGRLRDVLG